VPEHSLVAKPGPSSSSTDNVTLGDPHNGQPLSAGFQGPINREDPWHPPRREQLLQR
jgi:hypothetical protein